MAKTLVRITTVPESINILLSGQLQFMKEHYEVVAISSKQEKMEEISKTDGVRTYTVTLTRSITPLKDLKALWNLYKIFRQLRPDIVHSHTPKAGTLGMLAAKLASVPVRLHTIAGLPLLEVGGAKRRMLDFVEKLTYACATKIYPNSFGLKDIILENGYTTEAKLKVIGNGSSNGIDVAHFDPKLIRSDERIRLKKELGISEEDFVFVFVGRIVKDKGINELVFAFDKLSQKSKNIKLLMVGYFESELDPISDTAMHIMRNNKHIIETGYQKDVRPFFAISDVLTFPSYREGFPNVVMQAGAMGLPSIVSNINGCNEIIIEGENGYIIPVKNEEALYDKMNLCIEQRDELHNLKDKSRALIVNRYQRAIIVESLLKEYQSFN